MRGAVGFGWLRPAASYTFQETRQNELCGIPPIAFRGSDLIPSMVFRDRFRLKLHFRRPSRARTGGYGSRRQEAWRGLTQKKLREEISFRRPYTLSGSSPMASNTKLRRNCGYRRTYAISPLITRRLVLSHRKRFTSATSWKGKIRTGGRWSTTDRCSIRI